MIRCLIKTKSADLELLYIIRLIKTQIQNFNSSLSSHVTLTKKIILNKMDGVSLLINFFAWMSQIRSILKVTSTVQMVISFLLNFKTVTGKDATMKQVGTKFTEI